MRAILMAILLAVAGLSGCAIPGGPGGSGGSRLGPEIVTGPRGTCPTFDSMSLDVTVANATAPLAKVILVPASGYRTMLSCAAIANWVELEPDSVSSASGEFDKQVYQEVRLVFEDGVTRFALSLPAANGTLSIRVGDNPAATWNGAAVVLTGAESWGDPHALDRVFLATGERQPLVNATRDLTLTVNSSWNRGGFAQLWIGRTEQYEDEQTGVRLMTGALVVATLVAPNGTRIVQHEVRDWLSGEDMPIPPIGRGNYTLVVETRTADIPDPLHTFEVTAYFDY